MKGFAKMTREWWKFYLVALIAVVFLMLCDSIYVISYHNDGYKGKVFNYHMEQDSEEEFLEKNTVYFNSGKDYTEVVVDKVNNFEPFGLISLIIIVVVIQLMKQSIFANVRVAEFQNMLPIKQSTRIMYDYLAVLGILLVGSLGQSVILLAYQTSYNHNLLAAAKIFSITGVKEEIVTNANARFMVNMGFYILFLVILYTWIYLGMILAKNPIVGSVVSVCSWYSIYYFLDNPLYELFHEPMRKLLESPEFASEQVMKYERILNRLKWVKMMMNPFDFFYSSGGVAKEKGFNLVDWCGNEPEKRYNLVLTACIMAVFVAVLMVCILLLGRKRELSEGKLFYFSVLDYPFSCMCGWFVATILYEEFDIEDILCLLAGFIVAVVICLLLHPFSEKNQTNWEVK